jgi:hypothetical protein
MALLDMTQYELNPDCHFVDAYDLDKAHQDPHGVKDRSKPGQEIQCAYVMKPDPANPKKSIYLKLNDVAAFIGRFVVMGVPKAKIVEIVNSEYQNAQTQSQTAVDNVVKWMIDFGAIHARTLPGPIFVTPQTLGTDTYNCHYKLDFSVNPMGIGIFKG